MITLEEDVRRANAFPLDRTKGALGSTDGTDSALLATLSSRLHCRTPMKRLVREELATQEPPRLDGRCTTVRTPKDPAPDGVDTYRCMCGFTMDAPSLAVDFAAAS